MLETVAPSLPKSLEGRVLAGRACNEDAVVLTLPPKAALVQTVDILAPIVNDAFAFGRIAAANALSDVYAMGGKPWSAMSIACFPEDIAESHPDELVAILKGAIEAMSEASCVSAGGHTVKDDELKFGLAVTGYVDSDGIASNAGFRPGQHLLLTKPIGTGILATGVKAHWGYADEAEQDIIRWCGTLNARAGSAIEKFGLRAATDITGFGLGGHILEVARASSVGIRLVADAIPLLPHAKDYASEGLVPAGTIRNRKFCACRTQWDRDVDEDLENLIFDAQTSGGLLMGVPGALVQEVIAYLHELDVPAADIGEATVVDGAILHIV